MGAKSTIAALDTLLNPMGFSRKRYTWNRLMEQFVQVVDIQVSASKTAFTVNVGVTDPAIYPLVWDEPLPAVVQASSCTVVCRLGRLIDGRDKWWEVADERASEEVPALVADLVLPFFGQLSSRKALRDWLLDSKVQMGGYPPPVIGLAILEHVIGNQTVACSILAHLLERPNAWSDRVLRVINRLGC